MAHARVTLARHRSPNLRPESDHRYSTARCFDCFANHYVSNNCFYVWSNVFAGTDSIEIDLMTMKDWLFSQHRPPAPRHQQSCHIDLRTAQVYCFAIFLTCWHPSHITISFLLQLYFLFMYNHCHFLPDVFDTLTEVAGNRTSQFLC